MLRPKKSTKRVATACGPAKELVKVSTARVRSRGNLQSCVDVTEKILYSRIQRFFRKKRHLVEITGPPILLFSSFLAKIDKSRTAMSLGHHALSAPRSCIRQHSEAGCNRDPAVQIRPHVPHVGARSPSKHRCSCRVSTFLDFSRRWEKSILALPQTGQVNDTLLLQGSCGTGTPGLTGSKDLRNVRTFL